MFESPRAATIPRRGARPSEPALEVGGLTKSYGATPALRDFSLDVCAGEVHALVGENGAGKSTLVKILNGIVAPDRGSIAIAGALFEPRSLMDARRAGVATAFQELSLLPNLTVAVNLALPSPGKANEAAAAAVLAEFGATDIRPDAVVRDVSLAQRQRIELIRAMSLRPRLLVLDEPTAALAQPQWLFEAIERIAADGTAVLFITHRLTEVRRLCARATVLRNGTKIGTVDVARTNDEQIFGMMVGSAPARRSDARGSTRAAGARPALSLENLSGSSFSAVTFALHDGEILGIAALEGQGQRELFRVLSGSTPPATGTIRVRGEKARLPSPARAQQSGIGFLPEERKSEGVFPGLDVEANVSLPVVGRLQRFGLIDRRRERRCVLDEARHVDLPERVLTMDIEALSGGSQQKALVARVLLSGARTLILYDPTRGVDVGTKQSIYGIIRRFAAGGRSVLIYSTELSELVELCDRCLVMYHGTIVADVAGEELAENRLIALATGRLDGAARSVPRPRGLPARKPLVRAIGDGTLRALAFYLVLFAILAARDPTVVTIPGMNDLLDNAIPLALAAAGAALVVLTHNFDLSVAGVIALSNVLIATALPEGPAGAVLGLGLALAVGLLVGAANGFLVAYRDLQSVAATFATMIVCSGLALLVLGAPGGTVPRLISDGLTGIAGGFVPVAAIVAAVVLVLWMAVRRTGWGVALYAVGADEAAASLAGVRTRRTKFWAFCAAGTLYGLAGYMLSAVTATGDPNSGNTYLISAYAAVAVGGVSFAGGYGGLLGAMIGAATLSLLQKVLFSIGVVSFYTGIAQGSTIILALLIGALCERALRVRPA
ncbi:MAG TPA: ATP-binding cassette domain-containing protein [Candidatus Elarobacter sp.]|nr:ATP-binding cassette domain-containing protein [Candidatus Elarobacter sp.]